jgi:hypothetical protein
VKKSEKKSCANRFFRHTVKTMKVNQNEFTALSDGLASGRIALISYIATLEARNDTAEIVRIELYRRWLTEIEAAVATLVAAEITLG